MIKPLRKRHLQIWMLLAVLIPVGIISGYMAVPEQVYNRSLTDDITIALPVLVNKAEGKNYSVYLFSSEDKKMYQLKWERKNESAQASSLIYQTGGAGRELIGRTGSAGTYFFPLKADSTGHFGFIVYDIIHQQITDSIKF